MQAQFVIEHLTDLYGKPIRSGPTYRWRISRQGRASVNINLMLRQEDYISGLWVFDPSAEAPAAYAPGSDPSGVTGIVVNLMMRFFSCVDRFRPAEEVVRLN